MTAHYLNRIGKVLLRRNSGPGTDHYRRFTITDTPRSVELLWTSDKSNAENSDNTRHAQETDIHALMGFEHAIPASEWPQTQALDRAAIGSSVGNSLVMLY